MYIVALCRAPLCVPLPRENTGLKMYRTHQVMMILGAPLVHLTQLLSTKYLFCFDNG